MKKLFVELNKRYKNAENNEKSEINSRRPRISSSLDKQITRGCCFSGAEMASDGIICQVKNISRLLLRACQCYTNIKTNLENKFTHETVLFIGASVCCNESLISVAGVCNIYFK